MIYFFLYIKCRIDQNTAREAKYLIIFNRKREQFTSFTFSRYRHAANIGKILENSKLSAIILQSALSKVYKIHNVHAKIKLNIWMFQIRFVSLHHQF